MTPPDDAAMVHLRQAAELLESNQFAAAEAVARQALAIDPNHAIAQLLLAESVLRQQRFDDAIAAYRRAIELDPDSPNLPLAHTNLGVALQKSGRRDEAIAAYRCAVAIDPNFSLAISNLGEALAEVWQLDEASACHRRAVALEPRSVICRTNLAAVLGQLNRPDEQLAAAREAIALEPNYTKAHVSAALALLKLGRMEEGWREFEWRTRSWRRDPSRRAWDGSPLEGATIVLRAEQAFGDVLQIIRYATIVRERHNAGKVIVECQPPLTELLRHADGVDEVFARGELAPAAEFDCWMMSLPHLTGVATVPENVPYLHADPARVDRLRARVEDEQKLKLGLIWSGNPSHLNDSLRSCPLRLLEPLARRPDVRCFSLQKGEAAARDAAIVAEMNLLDLAADCQDFADTAAAMSLMDLILTVDTAPAHLAGGLGRRTWTMLSGQADWRWMPADSDRGAWYPIMRLFRQKAPGDWAGVLADVSGALDSFTLSRR